GGRGAGGTTTPGTGGRATGGTTGAGGRATGGTTGAGGATGLGGNGGTAASVSVLQHHNNASRDGVYVDARFTRAAAGTVHADTTFGNTALMGPVYAQPLYLAGTAGGADQILVASAQNHVTSLNASNGTRLWDVTLGSPVTSGLCGVPLN